MIWGYPHFRKPPYIPIDHPNPGHFMTFPGFQKISARFSAKNRVVFPFSTYIYILSQLKKNMCFQLSQFIHIEFPRVCCRKSLLWVVEFPAFFIPLSLVHSCGGHKRLLQMGQLWDLWELNKLVYRVYSYMGLYGAFLK